MKLSKSGIFLIVVLVIAIGLGVWVAIMTCDVLAKDPITISSPLFFHFHLSYNRYGKKVPS